MVPSTHAVRYHGRRQTAAKLAERLPDSAWRSVTVGAGTPNVDQQVWACLPLSEACTPGMRRWLLIRRSGDDGGDPGYSLAHGADNTSQAELLRVCGVRWQVEEGFAQAKGEVGLDQHEVRTWDAWHRFVTLCPLAHAGLVVMRRAANQDEIGERGGGDPGPIPITVPEVRRLFLALTGSREQRRFRLRWSVCRRAHQAIAARCHARRRAQGRDRPIVRLAPAPPASGPAKLTDAEGERVRPLLSPPRPPTRRPRHDHRTLLSGILWVVRTHSSWRDLPPEFGKWETAYKR